MFCLPRYDKNYDWVLDTMPTCFVTHLKTIEISEFRGDEKEMHAVKIFLESASVLERIVIVCDDYHFKSRGGLKKQKEIYKQILLFPRGSMSCAVDFFLGFNQIQITALKFPNCS